MAYGRAFKDPEVLKEMLSRYKAGESTTVLGQAYGVDHTSIIYQTQKAGLLQKGRPKGSIQYKYQHLFDEENRRNPGHTYSEYLREYNRKMKPIRAEAMHKAKAEMVERKRLIKQGKLPHYFDETVFNASFGSSKSYPQPVDMMEES